MTRSRSFVGIQVSTAAPTGLGDWEDACGASPAPIAGLFAVDQEKAIEMKRRNGIGTPCFFRSKINPLGEDVPQDIMHTTDLNAAAEAWMAALLPRYIVNAGFDYAVPINEWDITDLDAGARINTFTLRCMEIIDRWRDQGILNVHAGIFGWSTGNPSDDAIADGTPLSMEQRLTTCLPAIQYACQHDHVIVLHVHSGDLINSGEWVALRVHRILRWLADASQHPDFGSLRPRVAFGEWSMGVEGIEPDLPTYLAGVAWYDDQLRHSPYREQIICFALYGYTQAATIAPAIPGLIDHMTHLPELPVLSNPIEPRRYDRVVHVIPSGISMKWVGDRPEDPRYEVILGLAGPQRESIMASADDAAAVVPECVSRHLFVYNVEDWGGRAAFEQWLLTYYPPLPALTYRHIEPNGVITSEDE